MDKNPSFGGNTHFDVRKKEGDGAACCGLILDGVIGGSVAPPRPELSTERNALKQNRQQVRICGALERFKIMQLFDNRPGSHSTSPAEATRISRRSSG